MRLASHLEIVRGPEVAATRTAGRGGFTMVEIALSIAVVAFALVAILGVLPTGMTVQKDNRDDTIIDQEGRYWIEAIRSGARGVEDLTNYVESITVTNITTPKRTVTFNMASGGAALRPVDVAALLSTPKYYVRNTSIETDAGEPGAETNQVFAQVKAITGPAAEKAALTNEFSFRYQMQVEITRAKPLPDLSAVAGGTNQVVYNELMADNFHDIRLVLRWPVVQRGTGWLVGNNKKTFRARVAGRYLSETNVSANVLTAVRAASGRTSLLVLAPNNFTTHLEP